MPLRNEEPLFSTKNFETVIDGEEYNPKTNDDDVELDFFLDPERGLYVELDGMDIMSVRDVAALAALQEKISITQPSVFHIEKAADDFAIGIEARSVLILDTQSGEEGVPCNQVTLPLGDFLSLLGKLNNPELGLISGGDIQI